MLDWFRWIALGAAIALIFSIAGLLLTARSSPAPINQVTTSDDQNKQGDQKKNVGLWDRWFPDSISLYTLFLVIFTALLAYVAFRQLDFLDRADSVARSAAKATQDSAEATQRIADLTALTQRASVLIDQINNTPKVDDKGIPITWMFRPQIANQGPTKTPEMRIWVAVKLFADPATFTCAQPTSVEQTTYPLGPMQKLQTAPVDITIADIASAQQGNGQIFLWGEITYRDIFEGTPTHHTTFCFNVQVIGDFRIASPASLPFQFNAYKNYNKSD